MRALLIVVAVWLLADLGYSLYVRHRIQRWESTFTRNSDGVREGCEAFEAGPADGRAAVLLIHGLNESPACYRQVAPELAKTGLFCRVMRLPGFAEPTQKYAKATRPQWLEAIDKELKSLRERFDTVYIVSHSLGGALSISHLCDHPEAADKVVLLAPGIDVSSARSPLLTPRAWNRVAQVLLLFSNVTANPFGLDAAKVDERDYPYMTPFTPRTIIDQSFTLMADLQSREKEFRTPVLLCVSRNDKVIDWQAADRFVRNSAAPVKEVEYFDDTGHALQVDHTWKRLAERIGKFLND